MSPPRHSSQQSLSTTGTANIQRLQTPTDIRRHTTGDRQLPQRFTCQHNITEITTTSTDNLTQNTLTNREDPNRADTNLSITQAPQRRPNTTSSSSLRTKANTTAAREDSTTIPSSNTKPLNSKHNQSKSSNISTQPRHTAKHHHTMSRLYNTNTIKHRSKQTQEIFRQGTQQRQQTSTTIQFTQHR